MPLMTAGLPDLAVTPSTLALGWPSAPALATRRPQGLA
ncbi:MAG: hypothetical protein OSP8Acid_17210 [uncultured Acidilobus sp. OSP8]|nr:MAG: hypothetical protein OSP8Acid_17210 [uncultured Acidilobus sp. OSP8]